MRFRVIGILMCMALMAGGCDLYGTGKEAEAKGKEAEQIAQVLSESADQAEEVVAALENVTGPAIDKETASRIEGIANRLEELADKAKTGAAIGAALPGPQQPWVGALAAVLGGVGTLAGAVGTFMERRRRRSTEKGLRAVVTAVNDVAKVGDRIKRVTVNAGVSEVVERQYQAAMNP